MRGRTKMRGPVVLLFALYCGATVLAQDPVSDQLQHGLSASGAACPPDFAILPCRCRLRESAEVQIWCSHSDLTRVLAPLRALSESRGATGSVGTLIDELILEGNKLEALPARAFQELRVVRLMLRENALQRLSASVLSGQEDELTELFIVEPELTHLAPEMLRPLQKLQAITIQTPSLRRLPRVERLPLLRYLRLEATEFAAWRGVTIHDLPELEQLHLGCTERGSGLDRLDTGIIKGTPRLEVISLTKCALVWLHPHSLAPATTSLKSLDLSDNLLNDVGQVVLALRDLSQLSELRLDRNQFRSLPEGSLVSLPALRILSIAGNQLTEVARGAFHMMPSLETLDLSSNSLKRLHPQAFTPRAAPRLQELDLSHNLLGHLAEVRPWTIALPTLRRLDVSDNGLEELGWAALGPSGHPALERLYADHNQIRLVRRDALSALPALLELHLRNNSLDERALLDSGSPWNLPGLKGLDLGQNALRSLDARLLAGLPSLRRIDLSENRLASLQGSPFSPAPLLEHVNLSFNALQALPAAALGPLRALYELDLAHNRLNALPVHPGRALDDLGVLNVADNQLATLPDGWTSGQSTQTLQLAGNAMRALPRLSLAGLTRLDVSRNLLSRIDQDTLASARELMYLNASSNELSQFPEGVRGLIALRDLDLSGNRLNSLPGPGLLGSLQSLRTLRLARNQLATLGSGTIQSLPRLASLSLADNRLVAVDPGALIDLPQLAELDMARNALTALPRGAFSQLPSLRAASLQGNRLKEFDASSFDGAPRLLLLDLSHNELRHAEWGRASYGGPWGGPQGRRAFDSEEAPSTRFTANTRRRPGSWGPLGGAAKRALETGPRESDLLSNALSASSAMPGLEVLDLSHNQLRNLEDAGVTNLPWLVELKVDHNEICGVRAKSLSSLSRLRVLSMRNNRVSMLQERAFRGLKGNMVHLDVAGNPLSCSCGLLWLQTWMETEPLLQPNNDGPKDSQDAPRCADGSLLRDVGLSRAHCNDDQRSQRDEEREEDEIMAQCTSGSAQILAPPSKISPHLHGAPNPEESEYFYEEFVEYPQGPEIIANHSSSTQPALNVPPSPTPTPSTPHYVTGETPTLYAGTINKVQPNITGIVGNTVPNNDSPITFFGYPIPSITSLWNPASAGRATAKRVEANELHITPYEEGFIPSLGPPRTRPNWVLGPTGSSNNGSSSQFKYESVAEKKKQSFTSTRQEQSNILEPEKNPMKFFYAAPEGVPGIRNGNNIPIDHRGSLPIRDDNIWRNRKPAPDNKNDEMFTTSQPEIVPSPTNNPPPKRFQSESNNIPPKRFQVEQSLPSDIFNETEISDQSIVMKKGVIPLVFSEDMNDTSTEAYSRHNYSYEFSTEQSVTTQISFETSTQTSTQISYRVESTTSQQSETTTTKPPPFTNLQLLVPGGYQPPSGPNKATITKVEGNNVASPARAPSTSRYYNTPPSTLAPYSSIPSVGNPTTDAPPTTNNDQQSQGTWWYYRDYNRTNLEPFKGEYLLDDYPSTSTAPKRSIYHKIFYVVPLLYFLFI